MLVMKVSIVISFMEITLLHKVYPSHVGLSAQYACNSLYPLFFIQIIIFMQLRSKFTCYMSIKQKFTLSNYFDYRYILSIIRKINNMKMEISNLLQHMKYITFSSFIIHKGGNREIEKRITR